MMGPVNCDGVLPPRDRTADDKGSSLATAFAAAPTGLTATGMKFSGAVKKATWVDVWYASSESWFKADNSDGARFHYGKKWTGMDWSKQAFIEHELQEIRDAGISILVFDCTNGLHDFVVSRCRLIASLCPAYGLEFCVAVGNADDSGIDERAKIVWDSLASESSGCGDVYFKKDGKPAIVSYVTREQWNSLNKGTLTYLSRFTNLWSSGGEANADKWGWQLDPAIGTVPSADSMYVSGSLFWTPQNEAWCTSLAFLDYNFLVASKVSPDYLIVGAIDDVCERNLWGRIDTAGAKKGNVLQMRDIYGRLSSDFWYNRVCSWLSKDGPTVVSGGTLMDGCYHMRVSGTDMLLSVPGETYRDGAPIQLVSSARDTTDYMWLYHLGRDVYRIVRLSAGKSLAAASGLLVQEYDRDSAHQFWRLKAMDNGSYAFSNVETGEWIGCSVSAQGTSIVLQPSAPAEGMVLDMEPVLLMRE